MRKLELHHTKRFNGTLLEYYLDTEPEHAGDFWITREQIGKFLGYTQPANRIGQMHKKHSDRFDKFSERINITITRGNDVLIMEVVAYSFKGLLEICRWSRKPNADTILDNLWEMFSEIERSDKEKNERKLEIISSRQ